MDILKGTISDAQTAVQKDITQVGVTETLVISGAIAQLEAMINRLLQGYTLEVKAVKK